MNSHRRKPLLNIPALYVYACVYVREVHSQKRQIFIVLETVFVRDIFILAIKYSCQSCVFILELESSILL